MSKQCAGCGCRLPRYHGTSGPELKSRCAPCKQALVRWLVAGGFTHRAIGQRLGVSINRVHTLLHPQHHRARSHLQSRVRAGAVTPPDACQECGHKGPVAAHHPDHAESLTVEFLCPGCHSRRHNSPRYKRPRVSDPIGLRRLIEGCGAYPQGLALSMGIPVGSMYSLISGRLSWRPDLRHRFCEALGVSLGTLDAFLANDTVKDTAQPADVLCDCGRRMYSRSWGYGMCAPCFKVRGASCAICGARIGGRSTVCRQHRTNRGSDRQQLAASLRQRGLSYRAIGKHLGVSHQRAQQLSRRALQVAA